MKSTNVDNHTIMVHVRSFPRRLFHAHYEPLITCQATLLYVLRFFRVQLFQ